MNGTRWWRPPGSEAPDDAFRTLERGHLFRGDFVLDTILALLIACATMGALILMSMRADRRFSHRERLPMQWSFGGSVNWRAPRRVALALTPALALLCLLAAVVSTALLAPRPGQEG